ncbi:MAG: TRAP transporter substrate-binding protein DctP, partial [Desulfatibacillaceae bacterium]|nr:TRAP transporter substrate-binding protein DctP [Desulfatibacillaceae bacterium]
LAPLVAHAQPIYTWRAGTLAPQRIGWAKQVEGIVLPAVSEASDGKLAVRVFWGGIMGDDAAVLAKMKQGLLEIGGFTGLGTVMAVPQVAVLTLPFLFKDYDEVDFVRSAMHKRFEKLALDQDLVLMLWIDQDFDQIYSVRHPFDKFSDFTRARFIAWGGLVEQTMLKRLNADYIVVEVPEISASMRGNLADASMGPAVWMMGAQMHAVVRYINPTKIRYSPAFILVTKKSWDAIPAEYTSPFWNMRMELVSRFVEETRHDNAQSLAAMVRYGLTETGFGPEDIKALQEATRPVWQDMTGRLFAPELLDELLEHLRAFRQKGLAPKAPGNSP